MRMKALGVILAGLCLSIPIRAADRVVVPPTATVERGEYRARDPRSGRELWRTQWVLEQAAQDGRTRIRVQEDGKGYHDADVPTVWTVRIALDISAGETRFTTTREVRDASGHPLEVQQRDFDYAGGTGRVITTDVRTGRTESRSFPLTANSIGAEVLATELRLLPDLPDQQMRFDLVTREGKVFGMLAKITGRERVDVPAGSFECYKVELAPTGLVGVLADLFMPKMYMWHTVAAPHIWIKFQGVEGGPGAPEIIRELVRFTPLPR